MQLKTTLLTIGIVTALGGAGNAMAQDAQTARPASAKAKAQQKTEELDKIVVTGIRSAQEKALAEKRAENTRVEIVTAEDIGKMPDKNVADALSHVSGVSISAASATEGAFDENDRVSMRGTSPSLTQTLVDGHNIGTGDWFVLNQTQAVGRSVSYSLLPSEIVDRVVVRKSSEAKLVEGGATGSIDIITRNPLQFDKGFTVAGSAGLVYADLPNRIDPQLSVLANWKNQAGNFGLTVQVFDEKRRLRRDGQESLGYEQIAPGSKVALSNPDLAGVYYPKSIGSAFFRQTRKRQGGVIGVEWKVSDSFELGAKYFRSDMKADNYNTNYMLWPTHFIGQGAGVAPLPGYVVRDNTLVSAQFAPQAGTQYGIYDQISRPGAKSSTNFYTLTAKWDPNNKLRFTAEAGNSTGHGKSPVQDVAEWDLGLGTGGGWAAHGVGAMDWNLGTTNTGTPGRPGVDYGLDWIFGYQNVDVKDSEKWARIDGQYFMDGVLNSIEFGVRGARHERSLFNVIAQGPNWAADPFNPASWPVGAGNYPGNFGSGLGGNFPRNIWIYTAEQLAQFNARQANKTSARYYTAADYDLKERSDAGYIQLNFAGEHWSGNFGVRYVSTQEKSNNPTQTSSLDPAAVCDLWACWRWVLTTHTYKNWLPSANFKYDLNDKMVLRLAASQTLTRPDYSALAASVSLLPPATVTGTGSGTGGNPDLKPILSTNFDATFEWYYAPRALFSAGVFNMDMKNYVALSHVTQSYNTIDNLHPAPGSQVPYDVVIPVNSHAKVNGVELAWQQPFARNFGVFANYTYAHGSTRNGEPMLGTSKNTYNLGGYFENDRINARVSYTARSAFYSGLDRDSAFFQDKVGYINASLGYKLNEHLSLALDALNLNNPKTKYYAESRERPRSIYENGRQYYLNLRFKF